MVIDNNSYMNLALQEAWKYQGLTYPNPAVGCCIVSNTNEILAVEAHHKAGDAHAEVNALKSAYYKLTSDDKILKLNKSADKNIASVQLVVDKKCSVLVLRFSAKPFSKSFT